jgi:hypothetical protein
MKFFPFKHNFAIKCNHFNKLLMYEKKKHHIHAISETQQIVCFNYYQKTSRYLVDRYR